MHRVFLDPSGKHCVATVVHLGGAETYYHHARWPRPKPLSRLRGLLVNAIAWNHQSITEASTKEVILGTESGQIFEMAVDEADKREKYVKPLFKPTEQREGIKDLQIGLDQGPAGPATMFFLSHSLGRSKQGRQDAKSTHPVQLQAAVITNVS